MFVQLIFSFLSVKFGAFKLKFIEIHSGLQHDSVLDSGTLYITKPDCLLGIPTRKNAVFAWPKLSLCINGGFCFNGGFRRIKPLFSSASIWPRPDLYHLATHPLSFPSHFVSGGGFASFRRNFGFLGVPQVLKADQILRECLLGYQIWLARGARQVAWRKKTFASRIL